MTFNNIVYSPKLFSVFPDNSPSEILLNGNSPTIRTYSRTVTYNNIQSNMIEYRIDITNSNLNVIVKWDKKINNIFSMFEGCDFDSIDLNNLDVSSVIDMSYIFKSNYNLKYIDLNNFDASSVINMSHMFENCNSLEYLTLNNINISSVIDMSFMFYEDYKLKYLYLNNLYASSVINISYMFYYCSY